MPRRVEEAGLLKGKRRGGVRDRARRLGFIKPENVVVEGISTSRIAAIFNGTILGVEGSVLDVYARIVVGYYRYVSAIVRLRIDMTEIGSRYTAEPVILPGDWFDFWGAEDPRASRIRGTEAMMYTGRTVSYFEDSGSQKVLPVLAVRDGKVWVKSGYITLPHGFDALVKDDKNASLFEANGDVLALHRPQDLRGRYYMSISRVEELPQPGSTGPLRIGDTWIVIEKEDYEDKIGWGPAPVKVGRREYLVLLHSLDSRDNSYKVFAGLIEYDGIPRIVSVTRDYIMAPKVGEELYGDRPMVVYPCGAVVVDGNLLVSYGAADTSLGFAGIELSSLLEELDRDRI